MCDIAVVIAWVVYSSSMGLAILIHTEFTQLLIPLSGLGSTPGLQDEARENALNEVNSR
jgi:hypothetical protein